jgi:hypothetical protein
MTWVALVFLKTKEFIVFFNACSLTNGLRSNLRREVGIAELSVKKVVVYYNKLDMTILILLCPSREGTEAPHSLMDVIIIAKEGTGVRVEVGESIIVFWNKIQFILLYHLLAGG